MKLLVWLVIVAAVVMWLLRAKKAVPGPGAPHGEPNGHKTAGSAPETMLQCASCGVHFPASEAVGSPAGPVFCSEQHRVQHAAR